MPIYIKDYVKTINPQEISRSQFDPIHEMNKIGGREKFLKPKK